MDHLIMFTRDILSTLQGWFNLNHTFYATTHSATATMDASLKGWGAHMKVDGLDKIYMCNNLWTPQESQLHINFMELSAIHLMLELRWCCLHQMRQHHLRCHKSNIRVGQGTRLYQ